MKILTNRLFWLTIAMAVIVMGAVWLTHSVRQTELTVEVDDAINVTPEQIESIKAIGEWEFLSIADEELVDTVRKGIFSDDHLVRIYYGTLRLGINMHHAQPGWLRPLGDSIVVTLPPIELLDNDFIDEARTKSFHESGRWTGADREALFRRAHRQMKSRCLTPQNIQMAQRNGKEQFRKMLLSMGFRHVSVGYETYSGTGR